MRTLDRYTVTRLPRAATIAPMCHYATLRGHETSEEEDNRAVVERETLDGGFVPVCDSCADLTSYYPLAFRKLGARDEEMSR